MKGEIRHICMADDDPDDYLLFYTILKEINDSVQLVWFTNGKELLKHLNSADNLPDLILLDMNMPGHNGDECLQNIKENPQLSHIPVVILSTASSPTALKRVYENGALKYFIKPHSVEGYTKVIEEILQFLNIY